MNVATLVAEIVRMLTRPGQFGLQRWTFTVEAGQGETYSHGRPTLYGHSKYGRGSVLAGRDQRVWLGQWESWAEANRAIAQVRADLAAARKADRSVPAFRCEVMAGSTHVPVDQLTAGLPDEDGRPSYGPTE